MKTKLLNCCCCGGRHLGRQFHNQDTGYGLCSDCATMIAQHRPFGCNPMTQQEMERTYGVRGIHYDIQGEAA